MSTTSSSGAAPLQQITGLASGLDTNSIINSLMTIERQPLVNLQNKQTIEQARQADLQKIQTQLQTFNNAVASLRDVTIWGDTQAVSSSDPTKLGAATGHRLQVRDVRLNAGAQFIVAICGDVMTMPGLPRVPSAARIDVTADGRITGLF